MKWRASTAVFLAALASASRLAEDSEKAHPVGPAEGEGGSEAPRRGIRTTADAPLT